MYFLYFDPGVGALIIQTIVAAIAGIVLFSKNLMFKIKSFFGFSKTPDDFYDDIEVKKPDSENH